MRFATLVFRNLARQRVRSALTVGGIAVAIAAVVALLSIARNYEYSQRAVLEARGVDLIVVRAGSIQHLSSVLEANLGERILQLPGVRSVWPRLTDVLSFPDSDLYGVPVHGLSRDSPTLEGLDVATGRRIGLDDERSIMFGELLARRLERTVGQQFELIEGEPPFHVVGVFRSRDVFENGSIMMHIDELQTLMLREGDVTQFNVTSHYHDQQPLERLRDEIEALAPGLETLPTSEYVDRAIEVRMAEAVSWLTSMVALVIGAFGVVNTMSAAVFERTHEFALLRALGWRRQTVFKLVLFESALLAFGGAVVGTVAAITLTFLLSSLPASGRLISGEIAPEAVLGGLALAACMSLVGGLYPAYRATQLSPIDGLGRF